MSKVEQRTSRGITRLQWVQGLLIVAFLALASSFGTGRSGQNLLAEEGAAVAFVGKVIDREGLAHLRPTAAERWSLAQAGQPLSRGDQIKTGTRGANAVKMTLKEDVELILGPRGLIEIRDAETVRLIRGDLRVVSRGVRLRVVGPEGGSDSNGGSTHELFVNDEIRVLRARNERLSVLEKEPRWLTGYLADASTEAMGSLLANVDGRNVALTLGYHKVTVDIRDQIARTRIEESFVNHTSSVLEGVFYFPLPPDASISGFSMWVGNKKVPGEIVEKRRAREIYETILREKRDPGLLEWSGGNIFKARVYPIGGEKRIEIVYTQVYPSPSQARSSIRLSLRLAE